MQADGGGLYENGTGPDAAVTGMAAGIDMHLSLAVLYRHVRWDTPEETDEG